MPVNETLAAGGLAVVIISAAALFTSGHGAGQREEYYGPILAGANGGAGTAQDAAMTRTQSTGKTNCVAIGHCSQVEFDNWAYGQTKTAIRNALGVPLIVNANDSWYYSTPPIYDRDAGIQVPVTVQFSGLLGPNATVVSTRF